MGLITPRHVGSSYTRNWTCDDRQILYHWATRKASGLVFIMILHTEHISFLYNSIYMLYCTIRRNTLSVPRTHKKTGISDLSHGLNSSVQPSIKLCPFPWTLLCFRLLQRSSMYVCMRKRGTDRQTDQQCSLRNFSGKIHLLAFPIFYSCIICLFPPF